MSQSPSPLAPTVSPARRAAMIVGALAWLSTMEFFLAQFIAGSAAQGYSLLHQDISFLGISGCGGFVDPMTGASVAVCSPRHEVFNFGLAMAGAFMAAGAVLTRPFWGCDRRAGLGLALMTGGGIGGLMAGVWPVDVDPQLHGAGATLNFTVGKVGLLLLGMGIVRQHRWLGRAAIAAAAVSLVAVVLYGQAEAMNLPRGLVERVVAWPETAWLIAAGYVALNGLLCGWGREGR